MCHLLCHVIPLADPNPTLILTCKSEYQQRLTCSAEDVINAPEGISALVSGRNILLLALAPHRALDCLTMLQAQLLQLVFSGVAGSIQLVEVFAPPLAAFGGAP